MPSPIASSVDHTAELSGVVADSPFDLHDHRVHSSQSCRSFSPTATITTPSGPTRPCKCRSRRIEDFVRQLWIVDGARKNESAH
jgi:hypothetical protein